MTASFAEFLLDLLFQIKVYRQALYPAMEEERLINVLPVNGVSRH